VRLSRKLPFYFDLPKAIAISMAIHVILMIGLPEFKKPLLIPQEMSVTISSSPIQEPIEKIETPQPVKKVEPIQKKITPIIDKNATSVAQPTPKEVAPSPPAETISKIPNIVPQEQLTQHLESYSSLLANAIAKYKQYPKIAQMRGWQGDIVLEVKLNGDGALISSKIIKGSGFDVLDNEGLEMVKRASPFPLPPEILKGKSFTILVPIRFKLE
jgi:protein TonB